MGLGATDAASQTGRRAHYIHPDPFGSRTLAVLGSWLAILATLAALAAPLSAMAQTPSRVTQIWKRLQAEAGIALVLQAAGAHASRSHLAAFKTRSRWYAALPKRVSLRLQQHQEDGWRGTLYDDEGWSQRNLRDARMGWRVEAEWALSELIYNPHELAVEKVRLQQARLQSEALDEVARLYFERRNLQLQFLLDGSMTLMERSKRWIRIQALSARLDRLTGGLLSKRAIAWWRPEKTAPTTAPE
jgi:hypothetical protein